MQTTVQRTDSRSPFARFNRFQGRVFLALLEEAGVSLLDGVDRYAIPLRAHFAREFFGPHEGSSTAPPERPPVRSERAMSGRTQGEVHDLAGRDESELGVEPRRADQASSLGHDTVSGPGTRLQEVYARLLGRQSVNPDVETARRQIMASIENAEYERAQQEYARFVRTLWKRNPVSQQRLAAPEKARSTRVPHLLIVTLLGAGFASGCQELKQTAIAAGLVDPAPLDPFAFIVECDATVGSSCSAPTLEATISDVVHAAAHYPGSTVDLYLTGCDYGETSRVGRFAITAPASRSELVIDRHREALVEQATSHFLATFDSLDVPWCRNRSPLIEALDKAALHSASFGSRRVFVVIGDGLQYGDVPTLRWECSRLPQPDRLVELLDERDLLTEGMLQGAHVIFAYQSLGDIDGTNCRMDASRAKRMRSLWTSILTRAGAPFVQFTHDAPGRELSRIFNTLENSR